MFEPVCGVFQPQSLERQLALTWPAVLPMMIGEIGDRGLRQTGNALIKMGRPVKITRPIGLDVSLRRALRMMNRPEDRMKCFREWRRVLLRAKLKREPTDQEVEDEIKLFREPGFDGANCQFGFWDSLADFVLEFHKQNRIKRAQTAAAKRWSKNSGKKSLA